MMKKKDTLLLYILIVLEFVILCNSKIVIKTVIDGSLLFIRKIFPSLFPTMFIGLMLINNNIIIIVPKFIKRIFNKLFNFDDNMTNIFIMSMFCGTPSNALFINNYLNKKLISKKTAENLLCVTHFINPLFIINIIGNEIFHNKLIGVYVLILLYLSNFIKAFILKDNFISTNTKEKITKSSFITSLNLSIKKTISSLLNIFAVIILFNLLTTLIIYIFKLNSTYQFIINSFLEMTGGIIKLSNLSTSYIIKFILSYYFISFGGICIWMQVMSMFESDISFKKYIISRFL